MDSNNKYRRRGPFIFLFIVTAVLGISAVVMLLWNEILPSLIHVEPISYWHAMGLLVLCRTLFGGFRFGGGRPGGWRNQQWREKWGNMSEEEKAALKQKMKERWGKGCGY